MRGVSIQLENGLQLDLSETEVMVSTYAVNNLQDVDSRQTHYTNTFKIPLTQANAEALELPEHINTYSTLPYRRIPVKIIEDSLSVLDGTMRLVGYSDGMIDCQITGGNYNFFELIEGKKLNELDLSGLNHTWNLANIVSAADNTWKAGYIYANVNYGRNLDDARLVDDYYPSVFVKYLIDMIARKNNFRIRGDFWHSPVLEKMILLTHTFPSLDEEYTKARSFRVGYTGGVRYEYSSGIGDNSDLQVRPVFNNTTDVARDYFVGKLMDYSSFDGSVPIPETGIYSSKCTYHVYYEGRVKFYAWLFLDGVRIQEKEISKNTLNPGGKFEDVSFTFDEFVASEGQVATIVFRVKKNGNILQPIAKANIYLDDKATWELNMQQYVIPGADISVTSILPDIEQKDLFLLLANQFNLLFITDTRNRILYIEPFDKVPNGIRHRGIDLSDRLDFSEPPELDYLLEGYGQQTILQYADETFKGILTLTNEHLEQSIVGYDSVFALQDKPIISIEEKSRFSVWAQASIYTQSPIQDYVYYPVTNKYYKAKHEIIGGEDPTNGAHWEQINYLEYLQLFSYEDVDPPLALLDTENTEPVTIFEGADAAIHTVNITIEPLKFDLLVKQNYRYLQAALNNNKFVRVKLRLDTVDIVQLDFTKPVRLQSDHLRYGQTVTGWFFIQQIEEYAHGYPGSTWVQLMRIEIPSLTSVTKPTFQEGYLIQPNEGYVLQPDNGRIRLPG
ncbi:hypothetical protein QNI16_21620 [Cytophagaceae bacterium YF14B1]|uniref:Uncharacterized protein n=1 Tax=Xanthocytophaga flava TaxID=3048013 RepID=A0AAE3QPL1_9BACT|nr:hypothetical protein [Xanthocytophaga flavus]MDJ1483112.1 hypothetical protein [Xanthocytophaga flavus]